MKSIGWRIILCIARFKALRPRQRLIYFENASTSQRVYTITCSTRQRLIEQILDRGIIPVTRESYEWLCRAKVSNACFGMMYRKELESERIPRGWHSIYIRFVDPLQDAMDALAIY